MTKGNFDSDQTTPPAIAGTRRRWIWRFIIILTLLGIVSVNGVAFMQAWAMTHYVAGEGNSKSPEHLSTVGKIKVLLTGIRVTRPINQQSPADYGLSCRTRHVASGEFDLETWVIPIAGESSGLVLMYHGYPASKASILPSAKVFHELGYEVEMVDFRGGGGSTGNVTTIGYKEADDVVATVEDARKNLLHDAEPIILYGQSMGAVAVLRAVGDSRIPGAPINAIIIESPYDRLLATAGNRFHSMHLPAFPLAQLLIFWGGAQQGYWGFGMNPADFAAGVHCPVLMFHGALDARVTTAQAKNVFDHLAGQKQLEIYANGGHLSFLSSDPGRWRRSVGHFLSKSIPIHQ